jgi:hypothetical protein
MASDILPAKSRQRSGHRRIRGANPESNRDTYSYRNSYVSSGPDSYGNGHTHSNGHSHSHSNGLSHSNGHSHSYRDPYAYTNSSLCRAGSATDQSRWVECV